MKPIELSSICVAIVIPLLWPSIAYLVIAYVVARCQKDNCTEVKGDCSFISGKSGAITLALSFEIFDSICTGKSTSSGNMEKVIFCDACPFSI